eukprot:TRINITY_DN7454_c2_g1_i1.p1 TRINITY_DN7454_c2_g1~~TRINITY_DN7454_c2_g1_i1.p1  ORF type:complete len:304 (+),score=93.40 TRINITY_DN7454_c2_g1_i1:56-913(+)
MPGLALIPGLLCAAAAVLTKDITHPSIQETLDDDFVKDDDSDGGYWEAQLTYDRYRSKRGKLEEAIQEAKANKKKYAKLLRQAQKEELHTRDAMVAAEAYQVKLESKTGAAKNAIELAESRREYAERSVNESEEKLQGLEKEIQEAEKALKTQRASSEAAVTKLSEKKADKVEQAREAVGKIEHRISDIEHEREKHKSNLLQAKKGASEMEKEVEETEAKLDKADERLQRWLRAGTSDDRSSKDKQTAVTSSFFERSTSWWRSSSACKLLEHLLQLLVRSVQTAR